MEENPDGEDLTPFWLQSSTNNRRADRLRRGVSSLFLSSGLVVFLMLVTALFFLAFIVPSTLSFSAQIFRPNSVKKSWDSLNIVLVLVAVVFGLLSRNNKNEDRYSYYEDGHHASHSTEKSNPSTPKQWQSYNTMEQEKSSFSAPNQWYDYSDYQTKLAYKNQAMKRNSSSYPDLREFSATGWDYGDYGRRFYDDSNVDPGRVADPIQTHRRHRSLETINLQNKTYIVDTLVKKPTETVNLPHSSTPPSHPLGQPPLAPPSHPPEQPPSPPDFQEKPKRTHENEVRRKERLRRKMEKGLDSTTPVTDPPPLPEPNISKSERKRSGATGNATKDFLNSLYHKKKKKQRQKSVDNLDSLLHQSEAPLSFQIPPTSPPNSPSVFQNQRRRIASESHTSPTAATSPVLQKTGMEVCSSR